MRHAELERRLQIVERLRGLVGRRALDEDEFRLLHRGLFSDDAPVRPITERQVGELERLVFERDRGVAVGARFEELKRAILANQRVAWPAAAVEDGERGRRRRGFLVGALAVALLGGLASGFALLGDEPAPSVEAGAPSPTTTARPSRSTPAVATTVARTSSTAPTRSTVARTTTAPTSVATTTTAAARVNPIGSTIAPPVTVPPTAPPVTAPPTTVPPPCPNGRATVRVTGVSRTALPVTPGVPATEDRYAVTVQVTFRNDADVAARLRTVAVLVSDLEGATPAVLRVDLAPGGSSVVTRQWKIYASSAAAIRASLENSTIAYLCRGRYV